MQGATRHDFPAHVNYGKGGGRSWGPGFKWINSRTQVALLGTIGRPFA